MLILGIVPASRFPFFLDLIFCLVMLLLLNFLVWELDLVRKDGMLLEALLLDPFGFEDGDILLYFVSSLQHYKIT